MLEFGSTVVFNVPCALWLLALGRELLRLDFGLPVVCTERSASAALATDAVEFSMTENLTLREPLTSDYCFRANSGRAVAIGA